MTACICICMLMDVLFVHSNHVLIIVHYFTLKAMGFHDITLSVLEQEMHFDLTGTTGYKYILVRQRYNFTCLNT